MAVLRRLRRVPRPEDEGFTLIELLVVIIIIGILAAIAIPVYLNQRTKAVDAGAKQDLRVLATFQETYLTNSAQYADYAQLDADGEVMLPTKNDTVTIMRYSAHGVLPVCQGRWLSAHLVLRQPGGRHPAGGERWLSRDDHWHRRLGPDRLTRSGVSRSASSHDAPLEREGGERGRFKSTGPVTDMGRMGTALRAYRMIGALAAQVPTTPGMTLIELMWAMVIFAFVATATVGALEMSMKTVRSDRSRVAASDLAARELEIVRNTFTGSATGPALVADATNPDPLSAAARPASPLVVDNVPYTVARNTEWIVAGTGKSPCDGGATVAYPSMSVTVTVTWSQHGQHPAGVGQHDPDPVQELGVSRATSATPASRCWTRPAPR